MRILAEEPSVFGGVVRWLTTADVARTLELTDKGVRWLAREGRLAHVKTESGQYLFRLGDVQRFAANRIAQQLRAAPAPRVASREPRQLSLFAPPRLRLVGGREAKQVLPDPEAKGRGLLRNG